MSYLEQFAENGGLPGHCRISGEKCAVFFGNLTRLMNVKQSALSTCGASHSEMMILLVALDHFTDNGEHITSAEAARRLNVSAPSVSRSLKGLSEKGLVKRDLDENDRRSVRIIVTEAGEEKIKKLLRFIFTALDSVLETFSDEELSQMLELQNRFVNSLNNIMEGQLNVRDKKHHQGLQDGL